LIAVSIANAQKVAVNISIQLRNILTAYKYNYSFTLLIDESRTDLIRFFITIIKAIKINELQNKIYFITWQEIADVCGRDLKEYLENKYF
jgi:hypothetical protein